MNRIILATL